MTTPTDPLPDRRPVALVTGASRGIGKAAAVDLARSGFDVAVAARTLTDGSARLGDGTDTVVPGGLDTTVAAVTAAGVEGLAVRLDLTDRTSVEACLDAVLARFGQVDVLVNNGIYQGPGTLDRFLDLSEGDLAALLEGNLTAQLAIIRRLLPGMLDRGGGTIINLVSQSGFRDPPAKVGEGGWSLGYALTKAAFARVAPLLHVEHSGDGLRIFSVDPGLTVTERMEASGRAELYRQHFAAATPEVIGRAISWLATSAAADELRGRVVDAQGEVARRRLLPGWPAA